MCGDRTATAKKRRNTKLLTAEYWTCGSSVRDRGTPGDHGEVRGGGEQKAMVGKTTQQRVQLTGVSIKLGVQNSAETLEASTGMHARLNGFQGLFPQRQR